ncbi:MAG: glycosyltransferase family 1 protein [Desulfobacteraceae bacterium]|nr:glycosyltransferase family 1 protein [Desulfobacteraceae bacterium]
MTFLVECTYVFDHPKDNSGIQRVVRNIVLSLGNVRKGAVGSIPVVLKRSRVYKVLRLKPTNADIFLGRLLHKLLRIKHRYWSLQLRGQELWLFSISTLLRSIFDAVVAFFGFFIDLPVRGLSYLCHIREESYRIVEYKINPGDVLILLDSSWHSDLFEQVEELKRRGVIIVSVIYDLIPLTHPHFCDEGLVTAFINWFAWVTKIADGFIAISKAIRDEVKVNVERSIQTQGPVPKWYDYFYLGSDLDLSEKCRLGRPRTKSPFEEGVPVYLMVSTIEPRKNHAYLLDAFDLLWEFGIRINLLLIGKIGWKCQELMKRIIDHPEYNQRLYFLNRATDTELEYCYSNSRCVLLSSFVEGFGLPLVEAMQRGIPVMASDIPVFHEVGGDYVAYFDLSEPRSLANLVLQFEKSGQFPASQQITNWSWLTWQDSAQQFLDKIAEHVANHRGHEREAQIFQAP